MAARMVSGSMLTHLLLKTPRVSMILLYGQTSRGAMVNNLAQGKFIM